MDTGTAATLALGLLLGLVAGGALGYATGLLRARVEPAAAPVDTAAERRLDAALDQQAVVRESLERLHDQMRDLEHNRISWQSQLHQQVSDMRSSTDSLRRETQTLSTALRKPQVRGQWGELHLRRAVELAGMVDRCDFSEQVRLDDGVRRPDLVVHLAGGRSVVVDSKVPLDAFLDATGSDDDDVRAHHLARHARQLRTHVDQLGSKGYWRSLAESPEFVVLFVPAESFLSAALEEDGTLLEHAAGRGVVLATPTTLIALLRTVAHGWTHEALTTQAGEIHRLGRELHGRLGTFGAHLDRVGRSLNGAVEHYNSAVASLDSRVLVQARRFGDLGVTSDELPTPRAVPLRAVQPARRADTEEDAPRRSLEL
ncbi:DNA recombination protein RmuC [Nocardioides dongxiaopingii]|uniref:DNA recombination protein RmuC n=1 Tax=Nocardioides sp. S-1144 TaxID=2582905 RepID=UPI00110D5F60|nr:DNA recombination protein RmuC [Nocardioides sp. S-1144]QCW49773.1 DNA recombination protein RmuC [Nocardioides sp. S-1144]